MSVKLWLMFLVPTIGSLLAGVASATGNNIVLVLMCALVAGLTGIVPQLPDNVSFLGRRLGSVNAGGSIMRDTGMGIATGCFSFIITFFMPLVLFSQAIWNAVDRTQIHMDGFQSESIAQAIFLTAMAGAIPLNALIGATIIANAQRPWFAALMAGAGFMVSSAMTTIVASSEASARWASEPLPLLGFGAIGALVVALIFFLGALARGLFFRQANVGQETASS